MKVRGPAVWVTFLIGIPVLAIVSFAIPEYLAMTDTEGLTLSQFSYTLFSHNLALLVAVSVIFGAVFGGLTVHLFWHWTPIEKREQCLQCGRTVLKGDKG